MCESMGVLVSTIVCMNGLNVVRDSGLIDMCMCVSAVHELRVIKNHVQSINQYEAGIRVVAEIMAREELTN